MRPVHERRPATYEDVVHAPEHMTAELIDGDLYLMPRPAVRHARASSRIDRTLGDPDGNDPKGWLIRSEVELHLGQPDPRTLVLVPDLSGWRLERAEGIDEAVAVEVVPDWVCEILSPGTHRHDRLVKMNRYAGLGVPWAWLVDPDERTLEVYALRDGVWSRVQTAGPDDELIVRPFDIAIRLRGWFVPGRTDGPPI